MQRECCNLKEKKKNLFFSIWEKIYNGIGGTGINTTFPVCCLKTNQAKPENSW